MAAERRPSRWDSAPESVRNVVGGIAWAILVFALLAIFVTDGVGVGVVCTVVTLLIVIAVKVTRIAKAVSK